MYSKEWDQHLKHLEAVFKLLLQNQLVLIRSKCEFGLQEVKYLGHVLSVSKVPMDEVANPKIIEDVERILTNDGLL